VLLKAGRASIRSWLRAGDLTEPQLGQDVKTAYDRLADRVPWPTRTALQIDLAFLVLPGAALYAALLEHHRTTRNAAETVSVTLTAMAAPHRRRVKLLTRYEPGRRLFMAVARRSLWAFPSPGWEATWVERSARRVAFDMTRCFELDMLRRLDAAAIAPAYCAVDDVVYADLCPQLQWARTGTLATGATHCDFCFQHVAPQRESARERLA
jgi:hypothetical protein